MDWLFGKDITHYQIELDGNGDSDLHAYLHDILEDRLASAPEEADNDAEVKRRQRYREQSIRRDLVKALHAKGYYDASVQFHENASQALSGIYHIQTGPPYRISDIVYPQGDWDLYIQKLDIRPDDILDAQTVLQQQSQLYREIDKDHCYFDLNVNHAVILNKENKSANLEYMVIAQEKATFGTTSFSGQESVETSYLKKLVPWRQGDCFRRSKIENLRTQLFESGLFSRVETTLPASSDENGLVDIKVNVKERAHRTVRFGLNYYTDTGPGLTAGWEHRNIFGQAEKLSADLTLSTIEQNLKTSLSKPFFVRNDQTLNLSSSIKRQDTDAFEEIGLDIGGNIHRRFTRRLSGSVGGKYNLSRIEEDGRSTNTYGLLSLPGTLTYDSRNDTLDPRQGWYLYGMLSPYFDTLGKSDPFIKMLFNGSTYIDMGKSPDMVLALRGQMGSIVGTTTENVPATERFYAGGGGSVRGYGFQDVGPMRGGNPEGGRSVVTGSVELRYKLTEKIGMVTFVDVGSVANTTTPDFHDPAIGVGLGARYYTDFGPIRFDIGVPLTQKKQTDDAFQFYISIGQAF